MFPAKFVRHPASTGGRTAAAELLRSAPLAMLYSRVLRSAKHRAKHVHHHIYVAHTATEAAHPTV